MKLSEIPESEPWQESDSDETSYYEADLKTAKKKKLSWERLFRTGFGYALYVYFFLKAQRDINAIGIFRQISKNHQRLAFCLYSFVSLATAWLIKARTKPTRFCL